MILDSDKTIFLINKNKAKLSASQAPESQVEQTDLKIKYSYEMLHDIYSQTCTLFF